LKSLNSLEMLNQSINFLRRYNPQFPEN